MAAVLEVIAASLEDCVQAEAGGADRLELVASPELGGLTPPFELVEQALNTVKIPVRVILRHQPSMSAGSLRELHALQHAAAQFARLAIDGLVIGFVQNGAIDTPAVREICTAAPHTPLTFHRAFDVVADQARALEEISHCPQIDRILTRGAGQSGPERFSSALSWQQKAAPRLTIVWAAGRDAAVIDASKIAASGLELHVGRAARSPQTAAASVSRAQVASLKLALNGVP